MAEQKSRGRPLWLGDYPLARKTVLLHAEQGLGDTIQFARYVPLLAANGAKVVLEVQPELTALMARLEGAATVIARGAAAPQFDGASSAGQLAAGVQDRAGNSAGGYSVSVGDDAHLAKWSARIGALERPRIALACAGNPSHPYARNRSIAFAKLLRLRRPSRRGSSAFSAMSAATMRLRSPAKAA